MTHQLIHGDCLEVLRTLPAESVNCCVTSPPYWGLRDYGVDGQLGLEATPEEYVAKMVEVFREVRRVLRDDGTLWLNIGDTYNAYNGGAGPGSKLSKTQSDNRPALATGYGLQCKTLKPKDLVGIPWRLAFALQADGWWLRQDIIWHKPNPMPESVRDRCTKSHEYIFLLAKADRYYYDADAIREEAVCTKMPGRNMTDTRTTYGASNGGNSGLVALRNRLRDTGEPDETRNKRSVWTVTTKPYSGAHFATFPPDLIEPCILAGCPEGGTVLDPFLGSGTTAQVCYWNRRDCIGIELNAEYVKLAESRAVTPRVVEKRQEDAPGQLTLFSVGEATQ
jgi:DNA modification methylase